MFSTKNICTISNSSSEGKIEDLEDMQTTANALDLTASLEWRMADFIIFKKSKYLNELTEKLSSHLLKSKPPFCPCFSKLMTGKTAFSKPADCEVSIS